MGEGSEQSLPWKWSKDQIGSFFQSKTSSLTYRSERLEESAPQPQLMQGPSIRDYEGPSPGGRWISCFSLCRMKPDDGWDQSKALDPGEATLGQGAYRLHPAWLRDVLPEWLWVTSHPIKNGEGGMQKEKELCFKPSITFEPYNCSWGQIQRAFSSPISFVIQ